MNKTQPKALKKEDWEKLKRKYSELNLQSWENLDGLKKLSLLRGANIKLDDNFLFGKDYILKYPDDLYLETRKIILHPTTLNRIRHLALDERIDKLICKKNHIWYNKLNKDFPNWKDFNIDKSLQEIYTTLYDINAVSYTHLTLPTTPYV